MGDRRKKRLRGCYVDHSGCPTELPMLGGDVFEVLFPLVSDNTYSSEDILVSCTICYREKGELT